MPKPSFLNGDFYYYAESGIFDVADVIARAQALLTGIGWTDLGSNELQSPAAGPAVLKKCMRVQLTRYAADSLNFQVRDMFGRGNGIRGMNIAATGVGSTMHYFYGPRHVCIGCQNTDELAFAALIDPAPQPEDAVVPGGGTVMNGTRSSNAGSTGYAPPSYIGLRVMNNPTASYSLSTQYVFWENRTLRTSRMDYMFWPYEIGEVSWWGGRVPHCLICGPSSLFPRYASFQAPLGDGTNGIFKPVCGGNTWQIAFRAA